MDHVTRRERRRNIDEVLALRDYRHSSAPFYYDTHTHTHVLTCADIVQYIAAYKLQKEVWVVMEFMEVRCVDEAFYLLANLSVLFRVAHSSRRLMRPSSRRIKLHTL